MEYLLLRLRDATGAPNAAPSETHTAFGALFAFQRTGLIDDDAAEHWGERIREETNRFLAVMEDERAHRVAVPTPPPPRVERAGVHEVLDGQLGRLQLEVSAAAMRGQRLPPGNQPSLAAALALVRAFAELGLLGELRSGSGRRRS